MLSFSSDDTAPGATLRVHVASGDTLDVRRFDVEERMSSLFRIDLVAVSDNPDIDFDAVVARPARFAIHGGSRGSRAWTGVSSSLQQVAAAPRGLSTYHLRIVPDLWLATQRRNYRVFQQLPELDIVLQLLGEWGVPADVRVDRGAQKRREYRVQYGESDYTFICRMLEDAGVSFHFDQGDDGSRLVLADAPQAAEPRAAALPFKDHPTAADREYVTAVRTGKEVRPGRVTVRDHDFRRPPSVPLVASAAAQADGVSGRLESYHYIPGAFLFGAAACGDSPAADDRGASRADEAEAARIAARRLDAERGGAAATFFETNALDLAPGVVMSMLDHPRADLGDGRRLLVVASRLQGEFNQEWKLEHEARSAAIPHHPPPSTPRPRAAGAESATVVGPAGEEIHCDEFGRVRVQFHWDREGRMDEKSSSWIHVSQPWSGGGFGGINLPRVGQEVLVEFLGGDPDRPVIVGRLYNNVQKVPYKLPENRTRSGWKSQSTGKGGGYNEIMFEDAAGRELLRVQAERDLSKLVKRDESITVGHDRAKIVQNDEIVTIGRDRAKIVKNDETSIVERDRRRIVKNDETVTVEHDRVKTVQNDETVTIGNSRTKTVENDETVTIGNSSSLVVKNSQDIDIGQHLSKMVKLSEREVTGVSRTVTVGVNRSTQVGMIDSTTVGDTFVVRVSRPGEQLMSPSTSCLLQDRLVNLDTGEGAKIVMMGDTITIEARSIVIQGNEEVEIRSPRLTKISGGEELRIDSAAGDVIVTSGKIIKLNPDS